MTNTKAQSNGVTPKQSSRRYNVLQRRQVIEIQRARTLRAIGQAAAERGTANVTVAQIVECAGISRRTFYEIFGDVEDCFLAALDEGIAQAAERVRPAYEAHDRWRARIRSALVELLQFFDANPFTARLLVVEASGAGKSALKRRQETLAHLIAAVDQGRAEVKKGIASQPLTAEGVVGAVLSVIHNRMLEDSPEPLSSLVKELMAMIVLPYAGSAASRDELARPVAITPAGHRPTDSDLVAELGMRMTYRTVCVLTAVGSNPGSSNREIANRAGVSDPGQISKLLGRLHHLGLAEKTPGGRARGEPNSWRLTDKGEQVQRAIAPELLL